MSGGKFFYVRPHRSEGMEKYIVVNANGAIMGNNDLPLLSVKGSGYLEDVVGNRNFTAYFFKSDAEEKANELSEQFVTKMLEDIDNAEMERLEKDRIATTTDRKYSLFFALLMVIFAMAYFTGGKGMLKPFSKESVWQTSSSTPTLTESPTSTSTPNLVQSWVDFYRTSQELRSSTQR